MPTVTRNPITNKRTTTYLYSPMTCPTLGTEPFRLARHTRAFDVFASADDAMCVYVYPQDQQIFMDHHAASED
jgi:hypothetical protein